MKVVGESWPQDCNGDKRKFQLHTCDGEDWVTEVGRPWFPNGRKRDTGQRLKGKERMSGEKDKGSLGFPLYRFVGQEVNGERGRQ